MGGCGIVQERLAVLAVTENYSEAYRLFAELLNEKVHNRTEVIGGCLLILSSFIHGDTFKVQQLAWLLAQACAYVDIWDQPTAAKFMSNLEPKIGDIKREMSDDDVAAELVSQVCFFQTLIEGNAESAVHLSRLTSLLEAWCVEQELPCPPVMGLSKESPHLERHFPVSGGVTNGHFISASRVAHGSAVIRGKSTPDAVASESRAASQTEGAYSRSPAELFRGIDRFCNKMASMTTAPIIRFLEEAHANASTWYPETGRANRMISTFLWALLNTEPSLSAILESLVKLSRRHARSDSAEIVELWRTNIFQQCGASSVTENDIAMICDGLLRLTMDSIDVGELIYDFFLAPEVGGVILERSFDEFYRCLSIVSKLDSPPLRYLRDNFGVIQNTLPLFLERRQFKLFCQLYHGATEKGQKGSWENESHFSVMSRLLAPIAVKVDEARSEYPDLFKWLDQQLARLGSQSSPCVVQGKGQTRHAPPLVLLKRDFELAVGEVSLIQKEYVSNEADGSPNVSDDMLMGSCLVLWYITQPGVVAQ